VFSKTDASHERLFRSRGGFWGLSPRFNSFKIGAVKPQVIAFRRVRARLEVVSGTILLIDDNAENVAAARRAGWKAVRSDGVRALAPRLRELGLRLAIVGQDKWPVPPTIQPHRFGALGLGPLAEPPRLTRRLPNPSNFLSRYDQT
jgi:hypothetical protein